MKSQASMIPLLCWPSFSGPNREEESVLLRAHRSTQVPDEPIFLGGRLTTQIPPIKITVVGLPPRGSDRHDKGKNPVNGYEKHAKLGRSKRPAVG